MVETANHQKIKKSIRADDITLRVIVGKAYTCHDITVSLLSDVCQTQNHANY